MRSRRLTDSFRFAWRGLAQVWKDERNIRIHFLAAALVLVAGVTAGLSGPEVAVLVTVIGLVITAEIFNTAIEVLVDLVAKDYHPLAGKAKDMSAAGVLVAAAVATVAGIIIFARVVIR